MKTEETEKLKDKVKYIGRIACIYLSVLPWKFFTPYYCLFYFPRPVILNALDIDLYNLPIHDEINERRKKFPQSLVLIGFFLMVPNTQSSFYLDMNSKLYVHHSFTNKKVSGTITPLMHRFNCCLGVIRTNKWKSN